MGAVLCVHVHCNCSSRVHLLLYSTITLSISTCITVHSRRSIAQLWAHWPVRNGIQTKFTWLLLLQTNWPIRSKKNLEFVVPNDRIVVHCGGCVPPKSYRSITHLMCIAYFLPLNVHGSFELHAQMMSTPLFGDSSHVTNRRWWRTYYN